MTTIYMIRHAEAEGNRYRRIHGQYNSVVTARGWKQIAALAKRFSNTHIDAVYSSDLTRTKMTASSIYKTHGLPLNTTTRLREVCMGVWEDEPWGEAEQKEPEQLYCFNYDPENWTIEGREDIYSLRERIKSVILDIAAKHDGETVAVFTHGCAIRAFLSYVKGDPPKKLKDTPYCDNTAVAMLHVRNEEIEIVYDGDNAHLPKELSTFHKQHWWEDEDAMDRNNLWYQEYDPASDSAFYHDCLADTDICGPDEKIPAADPAGNGHSAFIAMCDKSPAGIIELDTERGGDEGAVWISFYYILPEYRRRQMSIQLIGQATSVFRRLGRERIRVAVPKSNRTALEFFRSAGFRDRSSCQNCGYALLELDISLDFE